MIGCFTLGAYPEVAFTGVMKVIIGKLDHSGLCVVVSFLTLRVEDLLPK